MIHVQTTNIAQHIPSGYSTNVVRNHNNSSVVTYCRGKDCIQNLCKELRGIGEKLFNTEKKANDTFNTRTRKRS